MLVCNPYEVVIHGVTSKDKIFCPSDWAERLCRILSSLDKDSRLSYSNRVRPILVDKVRCVVVDKELEEANPPMFRSLMGFAADNDLRVIDCKQPLKGRESGTQEAAPEIQVLLTQAVGEKHAIEREESVLPTKAGAGAAETVLREVTVGEIATAFAALSVLRPMLTDISRFVEQINTRQCAAGYRLFSIFEEGKHNAVSVYDSHEVFNLASGHYLHIDDIVALPQSRNKGYASQLLREMRRTVVEAGTTKIRLSVHTDQERASVHRLYSNNGFSISAYHFRCDA